MLRWCYANDQESVLCRQLLIFDISPDCHCLITRRKINFDVGNDTEIAFKNFHGGKNTKKVNFGYFEVMNSNISEKMPAGWTAERYAMFLQERLRRTSEFHNPCLYNIGGSRFDWINDGTSPISIFGRKMELVHLLLAGGLGMDEDASVL